MRKTGEKRVNGGFIGRAKSFALSCPERQTAEEAIAEEQENIYLKAMEAKKRD